MAHHGSKKSSYFTKDDEIFSNDSNKSPSNCHHSEHRQDYTTDINVTTLFFPNSRHVLWGGEQISDVQYVCGLDVIPLFLVDERSSDFLVHKLLAEFSDVRDVDVIPTVKVVQLANHLQVKSMTRNDLPNAMRRNDYTFSLTNSEQSTTNNLCYLSVPVTSKPVSDYLLDFDAVSTTNLARNLVKALHMSHSFSLKSVFRLRSIGYAQSDLNRQQVMPRQQPSLSRFGTLRVEILLPNVDFQAVHISNLPLLKTPLLSQITRFDLLSSPSQAMGYLTLNQTRKIVPLMENDGSLSRTPTVGVWVRLDEVGGDVERRVTHPLCWGACVRYLCHEVLQDRRFSDVYERDEVGHGYKDPKLRRNETFLLMILSADQPPQFLEMTRIGGGDDDNAGSSFLCNEADFICADFTIKLTSSSPSSNHEEQLQVCQFRSRSRGHHSPYATSGNGRVGRTSNHTFQNSSSDSGGVMQSVEHRVLSPGVRDEVSTDQRFHQEHHEPSSGPQHQQYYSPHTSLSRGVPVSPPSVTASSSSSSQSSLAALSALTETATPAPRDFCPQPSPVRSSSSGSSPSIHAPSRSQGTRDSPSKEVNQTSLVLAQQQQIDFLVAEVGRLSAVIETLQKGPDQSKSQQQVNFEPVGSQSQRLQRECQEPASHTSWTTVNEEEEEEEEEEDNVSSDTEPADYMATTAVSRRLPPQNNYSYPQRGGEEDQSSSSMVRSERRRSQKYEEESSFSHHSPKSGVYREHSSDRQQVYEGPRGGEVHSAVTASSVGVRNKKTHPAVSSSFSSSTATTRTFQHQMHYARQDRSTTSVKSAMSDSISGRVWDGSRTKSGCSGPGGSETESVMNIMSRYG